MMRLEAGNDMGLLTNLSLFSGAGGLDLGAKLVGGFRTVAYCEFASYAQNVLMSRIKDGGLDDAPIWNDVSTFDGKPWLGLVDVISEGFPCQDLSIAGKRGGVKKGNRSGLWFEYARIVREVGPRFVFVENVSGLLLGGALGIVLGELAEMGFDAEWIMFPAGAVGAPHLRERVFLLAYARGIVGPNTSAELGFIGKKVEWAKQNFGSKNWEQPEMGPWRDLSPTQLQEISKCSEPPLLRMDDGVAKRMDDIKGELKCCGNGVVPQQAVPGWERIKDLAGGIK